MLKPLLLSGWFRVQPFIKYVVVVILIAPLVAASGHSTLAKPLELSKNTYDKEKGVESKEIATVNQVDVANILKASQVSSSAGKFDSVPPVMAVVGENQGLAAEKIDSVVGEANLLTAHSLSQSNVPAIDPVPAVELPPSRKTPLSQKLVQKLKTARVRLLEKTKNSLPKKVSDGELLATTQITPNLRQSQPISNQEIPVLEQPSGEQAEQIDPIGSPHPIPWKWIMATQEAIGSKGRSGVRYYRSVPVISPDGKYAVYSRVQLDIKPEMYNSRVTSILFVEDLQTKKLRVMASTALLSDPLVQKKIASLQEADTQGQIGVLVPVSWSQKGDRFLARKFEAVFNTADATDYALIWDRQNNHTNTVAPAQQQDRHEQMAILLGWSKSQPDHVLFRAGELGEEHWPLVKVANDGQTVITSTDADQPITFGEKITEVWAGPQVASR